MTRGSVPNFLSNSQENFRKFGQNILGALAEVKQDAQSPKKIISDMQREIDRLKKENQFLRAKLNIN